MATLKPPAASPFFYIFDFYLMNDANDTNDIVPVAILYFYPTDEELKKQKLIDCSGMVGIIQYFKHDLFNSVARTFYFRKSYIAHEHYGRHSAFLCVPDDRYTAEEARLYLDQILSIFNMLYGTWNHVQSTYGSEDAIKSFLNRSLTPIISYVLSQYRIFSSLFATIDYTPLKNGYQRVLLEVKHIFGNLKSNFGILDGFMGYDDKILYSTCDAKTTYYLQLLFQLRNPISENVTPWEPEFRLRNGVSLYHIYLPEPATATSTVPTFLSKQTEFSTRERSNSRSKPISIIVDMAQSFNDSLPSSSIPKMQPHRLSVPSIPISTRKHPSLVVFRDQYGSSEETGFDTDTADESSSSPRKFDLRGASSQSENERDIRGFTTEESDSEPSSNIEDQPSITDDVKQELKDKKTSRSSSTIDDTRDFDLTIANSEQQTNNDGPVKRIVLEPVMSGDMSDDEDERFPTFTRERSQTTTLTDPPTKEYKNEVQVSWKDIPSSNTEQERQHLILYVQRNSRMMVAGIVQQNQLTDEYLFNLWTLLVEKVADMEPDIQVISTANETIRLTHDVKFNFNQDTHLAKFERLFDGVRYSRRLPSEDSSSLSFFARNQLNRNPQRTVIGLYRGIHYVSIDRTLPDRLKCSCGRSQETL